MIRRVDSVPRSVLPLSLLLLAAVVWLVLSGRGADRERPDGQTDATASLVPFAAEEIAVLEARRAAGVVGLAREGDDEWRFTGGFEDHIDAKAVGSLLRDLCQQAVVPLLPEGVGGARGGAEFGLVGPAATTLRVTARDGREARVVIGAYNPVRDLCYARVEGRAGIMGVSPKLSSLLAGLPDAVRLRRLWPPFTPSAAETLARRPAGSAAWDLFARDAAGVWWLRAPADGASRAGTLLPAYNRLYDDRVRREDGVTWWRASDRKVIDFVYRLELVEVRGFGPRAAAPETLRAEGLLAAPLAVRMVPGDGRPAFTVAFGDGLLRNSVPALRDGLPHILRLGKAARMLAETPLVDLLHLDALPLLLARADSFAVSQPDRPSVVARRQGEGKKRWNVSAPDLTGAGPTPADLASDLVLNLDRLPILRPLPPLPPGGGDPRQPSSRFQLTVWAAGCPPEGLDVRFGLSARGAQDTEAVAWFPATGQLLAVPREILITMKSILLALGVTPR